MSWVEDMKPEIEAFILREDCRTKRNGHHHAETFEVMCPYGNCYQEICSNCNKLDGGMGPMSCPCDLTPGWRAHYIDGMGKPRVPVLAKGRKTSRVQRSIKRHELPGWTKKWPYV